MGFLGALITFLIIVFAIWLIRYLVTGEAWFGNDDDDSDNRIDTDGNDTSWSIGKIFMGRNRKEQRQERRHLREEQMWINPLPSEDGRGIEDDPDTPPPDDGSGIKLVARKKDSVGKSDLAKFIKKQSSDLVQNVSDLQDQYADAKPDVSRNRGRSKKKTSSSSPLSRSKKTRQSNDLFKTHFDNFPGHNNTAHKLHYLDKDKPAGMKLDMSGVDTSSSDADYLRKINIDVNEIIKGDPESKSRQKYLRAIRNQRHVIVDELTSGKRQRREDGVIPSLSIYRPHLNPQTNRKYNPAQYPFLIHDVMSYEPIEAVKKRREVEYYNSVDK